MLGRNLVWINSAFVATAIWTGAALADFDFGPAARPASADELKQFFSGKTLVWPCKGCGAYYAPDGSYTGVGKVGVGR